jgi:hypothetical protein
MHMGEGEKRSGRERRGKKERRSGIDTRSEKEKRLIGERRTNTTGDLELIGVPALGKLISRKTTDCRSATQILRTLLTPANGGYLKQSHVM